MLGEDIALRPIDETFLGDLVGEWDAIIHPLLDGEEVIFLGIGEERVTTEFFLYTPWGDEVEDGLRHDGLYRVLRVDPLA